jgi:hypothetical protein
VDLRCLEPSRQKLVPDMTRGPLAAATIEAARGVDGELEGFSVLGVGAGTAKLTLAEHRAVDVALNETFARALRGSGKVAAKARAELTRACEAGARAACEARLRLAP